MRSLQIEPLAGQGTPIITFCLGNPLYVFNGFTVVDVVSASGPVSLGHEFNLSPSVLPNFRIS